ncbi:hypothetical protein GUJ93_ZPchr0010g9651 [Zizania palustris]|uniref:HAT C-terminal dimerisation domain-containing protein n=1 Tax=Zizania palustris TaxID=103762 RepID=A0A8J5WDN3_ZIZPA|nr:hypothetical protein GUJ93_ZPchr0010g9651 [Zizania palustris]
MDDYRMDDHNIDGMERADNAPVHQSIPDDNTATQSIPVEEASAMPSGFKNAECWKHFETFKELQNGQMVDRARCASVARTNWNPDAELNHYLESNHTAHDQMLNKDKSFSQVGRIIEERKSCLTTETVETIFCLKDWLEAMERTQHRQQEAEIESQMAEFRLDENDQD